jgi:hypothetical protein
MSEAERNTTKEYDQKHGTPEGRTPAENDTTSTAMPLHERESPVAPRGGSEGVE